MAKSKARKRAAPQLSIAVVLKADGTRSGRKLGDWASFVGERQSVIEQAIDAKEEWERGSYGPYDIYLGVLTEKVTVPKTFKISRLKTSENSNLL